jgi:DNA-binding GntR family transcriptional regulator
MSDIFPAPLQAITLKDRIVDVIRQAISSGKLSPGDRVVELKLARQLGVGTTAVREALFQLERLGLVTRVANRGTFITEITRKDARQIFAVRRALECLTVELLADRVAPASLAELQGCLDRMRSAAQTGAPAGFYQNDIAFHRTLWQLSGNRFLATTLETLVVPLFAFFIMRAGRNTSDDLLSSYESHQKLLNAIKTGASPRWQMESLLNESQSYWEREQQVSR